MCKLLKYLHQNYQEFYRYKELIRKGFPKVRTILKREKSQDKVKHKVKKKVYTVFYSVYSLF